MAYYFLFLLILFLIPLNNYANAETFDINMPTGSASPDAPYFWQNEKTGEPTGDIEISLGDTVIWKNGDQAKHTITSGTLEDGPDGIFGGTNFLVPGQSYDFTFTEKGRYPYFCLIHPWMTGVVTVTAGYKIIPDVGKDVGDGLTIFNVDYQYNGIISNPVINEDKKSITFQISNDPKSIDYNLMLLLPSDLIEGPYAIFVNDEKNLRFDYLPGGEINTINIELSDSTNEITIVGTKIVPEFGIFSVIVLGMALTSLFLTQKSRMPLKY
ncbi:MAG: plastocyanin/azurin family copper-binding protein [Nitrosopumilaceae archaeon]|jgi:plastocyanin